MADPADLQSRITFNPNMCGGRPCIRGMRIRVIDILDLLGGGMTPADILADYPWLEAADIPAALQFAARAVDHPVFRLNPTSSEVSQPGATGADPAYPRDV